MAGLPPDALGAAILFALRHPELIWAVALWMLNAILGQIFNTMLVARFMVYVWGHLSPLHRRAIREAASSLLPNEVSRYLGIMPNETYEEKDHSLTDTSDKLISKYSRRHPHE
jgi:hypothetical protein